MRNYRTKKSTKIPSPTMDSKAGLKAREHRVMTAITHHWTRKRSMSKNSKKPRKRYGLKVNLISSVHGEL